MTYHLSWPLGYHGNRTEPDEILRQRSAYHRQVPDVWDVTGAGALFRLAAGDDKHPARPNLSALRRKAANIDVLVQALSGVLNSRSPIRCWCGVPFNLLSPVPSLA